MTNMESRTTSPSLLLGRSSNLGVRQDLNLPAPKVHSKIEQTMTQKLPQRTLSRIKYMREEGYTQVEIAHELGISQWAVSITLGEKKLIDRKLYNELMKIKEER